MLVRKGNKVVVREAAEDKSSLNNELLDACSRGRVDKVKSLLEAGADPNSKDKWGKTPLHEASLLNRTGIVKLLLEAGADPNIQDSLSRTPLYMASTDGRTETVKLLLEAGADPYIKDQWGETPLHKASSEDYAEIVKLLLEAGADPYIKNKFGETPINIAKSRNNNNKKVLLIFSDYTLDDIEDINEEDDNGDTWLSIAIQLNILKLAKELIREGADINHISVRRAYMDRKYRNNETAKYVEDLVNKPKKKSKFDF